MAELTRKLQNRAPSSQERSLDLVSASRFAREVFANAANPPWAES